MYLSWNEPPWSPLEAHCRKQCLNTAPHHVWNTDSPVAIYACPLYPHCFHYTRISLSSNSEAAVQKSEWNPKKIIISGRKITFQPILFGGSSPWILKSFAWKQTKTISILSYVVELNRKWDISIIFLGQRCKRTASHTLQGQAKS